VTNPLHWLLQNNMYSEDGWDALVSTLERMGRTYSVHKVIPFSDGQLDPDPGLPDGARAIVMGTYTMARYAAARGWCPGAYLDNLDFEIQREHWGPRMLNYDARVMRFDAVPEQREPFFIRPVHDSKAFTGLVCDWPYYEEWLAGLKRMPETADPVNDPLGVNLLTLATPVMVCSKKEIWSETRTWIVNGGVVTASGYKVGTIKRYTSPEQVDDRITAFAQDCADKWSPNRAYVLDVAETADGLRIVEINNLNSAGFYKADVQRLLDAIERMEA
jgi:hypothetical protein